MKNDLPIKNSIVIPGHEIELTSSRSSGAGGQHVNKTNTRITIRWNVKNTNALDTKQKERVLKNLHTRLTNDGDLIIHSSASRSQKQNKEQAILQLVQEVCKALSVPKKRIPTKKSKAVNEARLKTKTLRSKLKKMRSKETPED
jgi:ribosome-associated protein